MQERNRVEDDGIEEWWRRVRLLGRATSEVAPAALRESGRGTELDSDAARKTALWLE